jgi:hypothetical protein
MKKVIVGLGSLVSFLCFACFAEIIPEKTQVLLKLTPRPRDKTIRDREVFFDQQAIVRVSPRATENTDLQIQTVVLYDEVQTTGKIKRKVFTDIIPALFEKGEEKSFDSKELRLTGKITRDGRLIGMKFIGSGARIYEDGKLVHEVYQPQEIAKDIAGLLPPLDLKPVSEPVIAAAPPPSTAPSPKIEPTEKPATPETPQEAVIDLFGYKFTGEEAEKIIQTINALPEEALVSQIGLSKQAAHNLVLKRPFQKLDELPKVSYVKKKAVETLKLYVLKK